LIYSLLLAVYFIDASLLKHRFSVRLPCAGSGMKYNVFDERTSYFMVFGCRKVFQVSAVKVHGNW